MINILWFGRGFAASRKSYNTPFDKLSKVNRDVIPSNDRRIGFAIGYIPTGVGQLAGEDSATLVRGEDRHRHFMAEPQPSRDLDPEFVPHAAMINNQRKSNRQPGD